MNKAAKHGPHHRSAAEGSPASGARSGGVAPPDRARVDSKAVPLSDSTSALGRLPDEQLPHDPHVEEGGLPAEQTVEHAADKRRRHGRHQANGATRSTDQAPESQPPAVAPSSAVRRANRDTQIRNPFNLDAEAAVKLAYDLIAWHVPHIKKNTPINLIYAGYSKDGTFVADYDESRLSLAAWDAVENLSDEEMPGYLREFVCLVLSDISRGRRPLRRKRGQPSNYLADMGLSVVATTVAHRFGLQLARGDAARDLNRAESACSIVQKALERHGINMEEKTIQVAVNRYRRRTAQGARRY
jgi:hypothetical protein